MNVNSKLRAGFASAALAIIVVSGVAVASSGDDEVPAMQCDTISGDAEQTVETTTTSTSAAPETTVAVQETTTTAAPVATTREPTTTTERPTVTEPPVATTCVAPPKGDGFDNGTAPACGLVPPTTEWSAPPTTEWLAPPTTG